jgi:hypothetical protein
VVTDLRAEVRHWSAQEATLLGIQRSAGLHPKDLRSSQEEIKNQQISNCPIGYPDLYGDESRPPSKLESEESDDLFTEEGAVSEACRDEADSGEAKQVDRKRGE